MLKINRLAPKKPNSKHTVPVSAFRPNRFVVTPTPFQPARNGYINGVAADPLKPETTKPDHTRLMGHPLSYAVVRLMYRWARAAFGSEKVPAYRWAEALGIHRASLHEWLHALSWSGFLVEGGCERDGCSMPLYGVRDPFGRVEAELVAEPPALEVVPFDPWTDRGWDTRFVDPWFPYFIDDVVDSYYLVFFDEQFVYTGIRRMRPNGNFFLPMDNQRDDYDHPSFWISCEPFGSTLDGAIHYSYRYLSRASACIQPSLRPVPPPLERRDQIDRACNGGTPRIRSPRTGAQEAAAAPRKPAVFRSWIDARLLADSRRIDQDAGHPGTLPRPRGGKGGGRPARQRPGPKTFERWPPR